ncbi:MAG: PIN domain-containing protein [Acidobacteriia bacterium]|nr:PIN domain-containing protein [Terriglobia bacterium]
MKSSAAAMAGRALIDTGAIVALLDRNDRWHAACEAAFGQVSVPFITSEAVLTEVFHLVRRTRADASLVWGFIRSGAVALASIEDSELSEIHVLMDRYSDRPMDFADATLVYLAKRESISTVFTIDFADFATYRLEGRRRFRILPSY